MIWSMKVKMTTTHSGTTDIIHRYCEHCGDEFEVTSITSKQSVCKKPMCHQGPRTNRRSNHDVQFIGIDGEGVGREDNHRYVLLGCGQEHISNSSGIGWGDALAFLYERFTKSPSAAYVGFFLGYDFTQWFRDLPEDKARALFTTQGTARRIRTNSGGNHSRLPVDIRDQTTGTRWEIDTLGIRQITFKPKGARHNMYVCDTGAFFQQSFLKVIDPKNWETPICTPEEFATVLEGKLRRASAELDDDMIRYNALENELLARVMTQYNQGLSAEGIRLKRTQWFGPGQAAQAWFKKVGAPSTVQVIDWIPEWARRAARDSYFGGWFEIFMHGYIPGPMWEYDIHSAYPHIIRQLPCLEHGTWTRGNGESYSVGKYTLIYAEVEGSDPHIGAMLHRDKSVNIRRPSKTGGWYWLTEVRAAQRAGLIHTVRVKEWVNYDACDCPPPLAEMSDLYLKRVELGNKNAQGKALKLVANSSYGKTAQSVGNPKYANPVYASLITSGCRTMILDAIASHPLGTKDVAMVATDGVYFRHRHTGPGLPITDHDLGTWEEVEHTNMTLFKPGVYWADKARASIAKGDDAVFKARGVNAKEFGRELTRIDSMWGEALEFNGKTLRLNWPSVEFKVGFKMKSIKQALQFPDQWGTCGDITDETTVTQNADPHKKRWRPRWENGIIVSSPWPLGFGVKGDIVYSNPYAKPMGDDKLQGDTPEGPIEVLYNETIGWETVE
jgi:hypothetical protein